MDDARWTGRMTDVGMGVVIGVEHSYVRIYRILALSSSDLNLKLVRHCI
jgi:hypothetical protein